MGLCFISTPQIMMLLAYVLIIINALYVFATDLQFITFIIASNYYNFAYIFLSFLKQINILQFFVRICTQLVLKSNNLKYDCLSYYKISKQIFYNFLSQQKNPSSFIFERQIKMLNQTNKTNTLERKTSAKLPKLTIQQQIDNNEVIERMNRKITFTKNQRHLAKTLPYVQAFKATTGSGSVFRVEPSELYFTNFEIGKIYQTQLKLVNKSNHIQRIKISPLQRRQFVVFNVKYPLQNTGDIAPGMQVTILIRFKPQNLQDNQDQLLIIVGDGVIKIPIKAQREKCEGQWPKQINCGHCWVGDQQIKQINIQNKGGQAIFVMAGVQENNLKIGPFTISPTTLKLQKNKPNIVTVKFTPNSQGLFQQTVYYQSNQGQLQKIAIKLKGGAYAAEVTLDEINGQRIVMKKYHNNLYLNNCQPGKQSTSTFKVHNHAVVAVDYLWHFQNQPNLKITESRGKILPAQVLNFKLSYIPLNKNPKTINAYLYLYNLPKQSILNNSVSKIINGVEMIQCLNIQIKISSTHSNIEVFPLHKRITQKLYLGKTKKTSFTVQNNSQTQRTYWITKIKQDVNCYAECQSTGQIKIKANQSQQISFSFVINSLDQQTKKAYFLINFDNTPAKIISIQGAVQFPDLLLQQTQIDFQLLRTHSVFRKKFKIMNNGQNDVYFSFNNPHRYYALDFYDFYQFEDEQFFQNKLRILNNGQYCKQQNIIKAQSIKILQFELSTKNQQIVNLDLQLQIKNGGKYNLKVLADIQQAFSKISHSFIPLKQLFQGNLYNSNKFLPKQIAIDNPANIKLRYQIILPQIVECGVNISNLTGGLQGKSKRRVDLILQPLKTGPFSLFIKVLFYDDLPLFPQTYSQNKKMIEIVPQQRKKLIKTDELKVQGVIRGVQTAYYIKDQSRAKKVAQKIADDGHGSVKISNYSYKSASASKSHYLQNYKIVYPPLQQINFYNAQINKVQQLQIIIQNNSDLTTEYEIYADNFRSIQKAKSQTNSMSKGMMKGQQLAFTSDLGRTYLQNRTLNQAQKIYLSNNKGISIMCEPNIGVLHKRQTQKIVLTMFNDTSGRFKDELVISIKDHEIRRFPINMQIKGTPVSFSRNQLGIDFNKQTPFLNAGTFIVGAEKSTRNLKVVNNGPKQIEIKWVIYPYGTQDSTQNLFNIDFSGAQTGSGNIIETNWHPIKPKPLQNPPFTIHPSNKNLKGRQQANFQLITQSSNKCQHIKALIIGQSFLIQQIKDQTNKQTQKNAKKQQLEDQDQFLLQSGKKQRMKTQKKQRIIKKLPMQELAIIAEAQIVNPRLKIDQKHQNHINKLERFAEIGNQNRTKANDFHRKIKLKNHQKCNIGFKIDIRTLNSQMNFFQITALSTNSPLSKLKQKTLTSSLSPSLSLKTKQLNPNDADSTQFILSYDSYVQIGVDLLGSPKDVNSWPLQPKIRKDGQIIIQYNNGSQQRVPLVGWLYRPFIIIQMPNNQNYSAQNTIIDFGVVHVNNSKKKSIYLSNPSKSAANWTVTYVKYKQTKKINFQKQLWTDVDYQDQTITDQKKCFRLNQDSGHILAQSIPIHYMPSTLALNNVNDQYAETHQPFKLDFLFKPQANVLYKSKFILKVQHGPSYQIIVRGKGTFQEQAQIK